MAAAPEPKQPRSKSADRRARLRAQGLRPIELWVPDVNSPAFRSEAHRQSAAIAASEGEGEDQGFIDSLSTFDDE